MKYTYQYRKKHKWKCMAGSVIRNRDSSIIMKVAHSTTELSRPINIHVPGYQSFCPLRNTQQTHVHPVRTYWFNKCLIKNGHSTKCNRKEKKYRKLIIFSIEKENVLTYEKYCMNWFKKNLTDPFLYWYLNEEKMWTKDRFI